MARSTVGIDIGSRSITAAELRLGRRDQLMVTNFGGVELPDGAVHEGEIADIDTVGAAIRSLLSNTGIRNKRVWLGVSNQKVVVRQIDLPWVDESELHSALRFQVQDHIPIAVEDAELDVHVIEEVTTDDGERRRRVLLVAAQREMIATHLAAARQAGLKPQGIDLNPFAVLRAVGTTSVVDPGDEVLLDVGARITNIVVHRQGTPSFVRILIMGGDDITDALAEELEVDRATADAHKRQAVVGDPSDEVGRIVTERADRFIAEVRNSLDYFVAQHAGTQVSAIVLTGGGAALAGLDQRIATNLRLPVSVGNPFTRFKARRTSYAAEDLARVGPTLATAIGLAMGGQE
jgi:type IV pilus assembly protein PilM